MITIQVSGIAETKASLQKALQRLQDLEKPLKLVGLHMMKSIDDNFASEGRPEKWDDLSPMTKNMRRGNTYQILQDTGNLRRSIAMEVSKDTVKIGTSVPYAQKLQFGGENIMPAHDIFPVIKKTLAFVINGHKVFAAYAHIPEIRTTVPPRPFVVIQDEDLDTIQEIFDDWLGDIVNE